jgi:hypothetical protein
LQEAPLSKRKHLFFFAALVLAAFTLLSFAPPGRLNVKAAQDNLPVYNAKGQLQLPANYREWIYLSTGIDMNYSPNASQAAGQSTFDNVFVNPEAWRSFQSTGTWPEKTMLILEGRGASSRGSINRAGHYQATERMGLEVHIKDTQRFPADQFPGGWAFVSFDDGVDGSLFPPKADCYTCHQQHAAVDTTFVQFYPTLLPIATSKHTLSPAYLAEEAARH